MTRQIEGLRALVVLLVCVTGCWGAPSGGGYYGSPSEDVPADNAKVSPDAPVQLVDVPPQSDRSEGLPDVAAVNDSPAVERCDARDLGSALGTAVARGNTMNTTGHFDTPACGMEMGAPRGGTRAPDAVFRWVAPRTGRFQFDTAGSSYDTLMYARLSNCDGPELACNDDVSTGVTTSSASFTIQHDEVIYIIIDGYGTAAGPFVLNIAELGTSCAPMCAGRVCGLDGCGGTRGNCATSETCNASGRCEALVDPRPEAERACPVGAGLRIQLWQMSATPRTPAGQPWDGVEVGSGKREFVCARAAERVRDAAYAFIATNVTPLTARVLDALFGDWFQRSIAEQCMVGLDWILDRYAGPDLFVIGYSGGVQVWRTIAEQDAWVAPRAVRTPWSAAMWRVPCQSSTATFGFDLMDEDVAFDDLMETARTIPVRNIPPRAICNGWGLIRGTSGMVNALIRLSVEGVTQSCVGLESRNVADLTVPR